MAPSIGMAQRRSFKRAPPWRRDTGPFVSFMREGPRVRLDFEYTPARVKAAKGIAGSRFDPGDKSWSIPAAALEEVVSHKEFLPTSTLQGVGDPSVIPMTREQALETIRRSPFSVCEEAIAGVCLELVVRLNNPKHRLRLVPRLGSDAHKLLKRFSGASFSAFDSAYSLPVERLPDLLKKLRDAKILFAVDEAAGTALAESAPLRAQIRLSPECFSPDDLARALLVPFVTMSSEEDLLFRPCYFTLEQFKLAFPGVQRRAGQQPFVLDEKGLMTFTGRMKSLPFSVWLPRDVHQYLGRKRASLLRELETADGPVDDAAAEVIEVPLLWRIAASGRGAISVNLGTSRSTGELVLARLAEVLDREFDTGAEAAFVEIPDSRLLSAISEVEQLCEAHGLPTIPRSTSFVRLEQDIRERTKARETTAYYASLADSSSDGIAELPRVDAERLFPHQRVAISWLLRTPYAFLGDDMGLGKTLSVLSYFAALRQAQGFELLLVVCPNSLMRNWLREVSMWFPDMRATALAGDKSSKAWALRLLNSGAMEYEVLIVNYEGVRLDYVTPELERLITQRKSLLCLDESQRVKNHTSKTFKAIAEIAPRSDRRVLLSGTPAPKDVTDLWAQMRILDGGERFGRSFYKWLGQVAELGTEFSEFAVKKFNQEAVDESILRVHEVMLRRRKEKVVNLPEKTFTIREIEMTGSQLERYDEIREGLILRMRSVSGEQFVRDITNILEEYLRAVQVASNPRLIDSEWKGTPAKFLELDEIVNEVVKEQDQKIVIWTNYLGNVTELTERYKELGSAAFSGEVPAAEREKIVRAFQEKATPRVLVAVPAAGGVGITLTAAQTAVYIDKTWNAEHWMQSVDRIHRIGQRGTVNVISFLGCKVEAIIHWNLRRKEQTQAEILGDRKRTKATRDDFPTKAELLQALEEDF